jgi:hypothetical protein
MAKTKETRIIADYGEIKVLSELFNRNPLTIRKALRGDRSVQDMEKIRKAAIERGAVEMTEVKN